MITKTNNRTKLAVAGVEYDFDFRIDDATELEVYGIATDGSSTLLTTGFSISFDTANEEGTVTFNAEPSTYDEILMLRNRAYTQDTDIPVRGGFSEEDIEKALDRIVIQVQQLKELTDYSVKQDITTTAVNIVFPTPEDGKAIVWDGTNGAMANAAVPSQDDIDAIDQAVTDAQAAQAAAEDAKTAAEAAQTAAESYVPVLTGNADKVLTVKNDESGTEWRTASGGAQATEVSFTNASLSTGVLTVTHNKGLTAGYTALVTVVNNSGAVVIPDQINTFATNSFKVDLSSYGTLTGTWYVIYITK